MSSPEKRTKSFNVLLTQTEYNRLTAAAAAQGLSLGAVIRKAMHAHFIMILEQQPTCANGGRCYVPGHFPPPRPGNPSPLHPPRSRPVTQIPTPHKQ